MDWVQWFSLVVLALIIAALLTGRGTEESAGLSDKLVTGVVFAMLLVPFLRVFKLI